MQLDITKQIDRYLSGELSASDRVAFEEQLKTNSELRQEVELQQMIQEAAIRASFRADVHQAARRFRLNRILKWGAAGFGAIAIIATTSIWVSSRNQQDTHDPKQAPTIALSLMESLSSNAEFEPLPIQYFSVPKEGDVFLSDQSVLLSVPEEAFLLKDKIYVGEAIVQFQEAIDAPEIVKAGLNSQSGDKLLETQGMFSIHAYTPDGEKLEINPKVGVYVQVPVDEYKSGMQLYDYVDLGNGRGDWQNPRGMAKIPIPVDMNDLDFYPEGYEDQLDKLKWNRSKSKRDSLYLSFEDYCSAQTVSTPQNWTTNNLLINEPVNGTQSTQSPIIQPTAVVKFPDVDARFPGGNSALKAFIRETTIYPEEAREKGLSGRTYLTMEIDIYGFITNARVSKSSHPILDQEALRIVQQMPQWIPAQVKGRAVRSEFRLPIDFYIDGLPSTDRPKAGANRMLGPIKKDRSRTGRASKLEKSVRARLKEFEEKKNEESKVETTSELIPQNREKRDAISDSTAVEDTPCNYPRINPSKVLAFWNPKFNNTNLATREFERRMKAIHETCNEEVLKQYTKNLSKPISEIDRVVVSMGYSDFGSFADEQVGAVDPNNPHLKNIKAFYEKGIASLRNQAESDQNWEQQLRNKWDKHLAELRSAHSVATKERAERSAKEETTYNQKRTVQKLGLKNQSRMNPVAAYPQFRKTIGFTARRTGGYNCDRPVNRVITYQAAIRTSLDRAAVEKRKIERLGVEVDVKNGSQTRETFSVLANGRKRIIAYNSLSFAVSNASKYNKIMAYAFPHQLESYQLLKGENGNFITSLNDDIIYDICIVGITDDGYEYFQKQTLNGGNLGTIELKKVSEAKLDASLLQLNAKRNSKAELFTAELDWIKTEKKYFKEINRRKSMAEFREKMAGVIYPCYASQDGFEEGENASNPAESTVSFMN